MTFTAEKIEFLPDMSNLLTPHRRRVIFACAGIFLAAIMVRWIVWQRHAVEIGLMQAGLTTTYKDEANSLLQGDWRTFWQGPAPPGNANILTHPPGYAIFLSAAYKILGVADERVRLLQIVCDALAVLTVGLLARELFSVGIALGAMTLGALSPQLSYNSVLLLPDTLAVWPLLLAVYCFIRASKQPRAGYIIASGVLLGVSCWLRANALLLPVFLALLACWAMPSGRRVRYALLLVGAAYLTIAPITLRNYLVFHKFLPLSLGAGLNLAEGIADYDKEGAFGLEATDAGTMSSEAVRHNRPEYAASLYNPDGLQRDQERWQSGWAVVRSHPLWFAGVAARRAVTIVRLERVPVIDGKADASGGWVDYVAGPLRTLQRLFVSAVFWPLWALGIFFAARERRWRQYLPFVLLVPAYYLAVQPWLHTEYRYVMAVQYFGFILAAVAGAGWVALWQSWRGRAT